MPQIDPKKLEEYAEIVFNRANSFNDYTLQTIGKRIKSIGSLSAYDQQTLKNMADISGDMEAITKELARITEANIADIEEIYKRTVTEGVNSYKPLYDFRGMEFIPFQENEYAKFLVNHWAKETSEQMINLSRTKALSFTEYDVYGNVVGVTPLAGAFQKAIDDAVIAKASGTVDFHTAMRETLKKLGGSGVRVNYGSGVTRRLDTMVRQNLLYGAKQAAQAYDEYVGEELGCDGFEVDYHPNPRPYHEFMGGKMFSYKGKVTINGITYEDGREALERLKDYGCLHFKFDVILGVSEPRYNPEELEAQKAKDKELIEYNGIKKTGYQWKQSKRQIETMVRQQSDIEKLADAAGDKTLARNAREKISAYRDKYDDLCDKVGMEKRYNRMGVVSTKGVDKIEKSGIIKREGLAEAGSIFVNKNERLFRYAKKIEPEEGFEDIVSHANAYSFEIDMTGKGNPDDFITLSPKQMVERIRNSSSYHGGDIRLIACQAGAHENGAAQQVADMLGKKVKAPTEIVNVDEDGRLFVSNNRVLAQMWNEADIKEKAKFKETGKWIVYVPKK